MKQITYLFIIILFFSSCTAYKQVTYFSDLKDSTVVAQNIENYNPLRIQKDDILAIAVSSLNNDASAIFNVPTGFTVDNNGDIQLPLMGSVKVTGLTTVEAREMIRKKLELYLKEPIVSLRLANFKISVLGDVAKPGVYPINSERLSLTDALGLAGDLNITGLRKNILLVREINNERKFVRLDMTSKEIFSSPFYYLQNNDVLYVQPSNAKYASVDTRYRNISIGLSTISIILVIISRL